jgi:hypothetical protein
MKTMTHPEPHAGDVRMWRHFCRAEHVLLSVGEGERCNWCQQGEVPEFNSQRPHLLAHQPAETIRLRGGGA